MKKANHMKRIETKRLAADITTTNLKCNAKIKTLKGYKSAKTEFSAEELAAAEEELTESRQQEAQAEQAMKTARNRAVTAEWDLHNKILGAKKQVVALYGEDSDEVQAVGLKKKSDWKRSGGRKAKTGALKAA